MFEDEEFDPEDHGIEMDEIAKMYAEQDMEQEQNEWAREQANRFYADFATLDIDNSIEAVLGLIRDKELTPLEVNEMIDNMITIFEEDEEYEKCHVCKQIKTGVNGEI